MVARTRAVLKARTSIPSPQSASWTRLWRMTARLRPRVASIRIPAQPLCRPSLIGTTTPGAVVGTLNGGMWKPFAQDALWPEMSLPAIRTRSTLRP